MIVVFYTLLSSKKATLINSHGFPAYNTSSSYRAMILTRVTTKTEPKRAVAIAIGALQKRFCTVRCLPVRKVAENSRNRTMKKTAQQQRNIYDKSTDK